MEDLLPEAARLAAHIGSQMVASKVAKHASVLAQRSHVPHRAATEMYCRGMLDGDPDLLRNAAERYYDAGRPLHRAKALEAAAIASATHGERDAAREAFTSAHKLYDGLGANWDLAQLRAQLRRHNIHRGPRAKHRQTQTGWNSLTPTETKIAGMVAEGLSNRLIADARTCVYRSFSCWRPGHAEQNTAIEGLSQDRCFWPDTPG